MNIFLDTTYILPFFGIGIKIENFLNDFKKFLTLNHKLQINEISLLETKGKSSREFKKNSDITFLKRFKEGLNSLQVQNKIEIIRLDFNNLNDDIDFLLTIGLEDLFDCIIFASAIKYSDLFITEDKEIKDISLNIENSVKVVNWKQFKNDFIT